MPKLKLYSIHGRNQRRGEHNEKGNARSNRRPGGDDSSGFRKQGGRACDRATRTDSSLVLLRRSATVSGHADVSGRLRKELSCQTVIASLQIGLHPPIAHPFRGAAQC